MKKKEKIKRCSYVDRDRSGNEYQIQKNIELLASGMKSHAIRRNGNENIIVSVDGVTILEMHKNPKRVCIMYWWHKIGVRTKIIPFYIFWLGSFFFLLFCLLPNYSILRIARDFNTTSNLHKLFMKTEFFFFTLVSYSIFGCMFVFASFFTISGFQVKMIHLVVDVVDA